MNDLEMDDVENMTAEQLGELETSVWLEMAAGELSEARDAAILGNSDEDRQANIVAALQIINELLRKTRIEISLPVPDGSCPF